MKTEKIPASWKKSTTDTWKYKGKWPTIRKLKKKTGVRYQLDTMRKLPGKRLKPVFDSTDEATIACEQFLVQLKNQGTRAFELDIDEREDALDALGLCRELGFSTLTDAMRKLAVYHNPSGGDITVKSLNDKILEHYENLVHDGVSSGRTLASFRSKTNPLSKKFGNHKVKEISPDDVWGELKFLKKKHKWARGTLSGYVGVWRRFFNFAQSMEYIVDNPLNAPKVRFEITEATRAGALPPPVILSIDEAKGLLRAAWDMRDRNSVPTVVVLLFAGLRPDAEALKLTWDDFELDESLVNVGGDRSKNEVSARSVKLCPAAMEWLMLCNKTGRFKPFDWTRNWRRLRKQAGIVEWTADTTRHSFASYSYAMHRDPDQLRRELGHVDERMLNHYRHVSPKVNKNAKHYFDLTPEKVLGPDECKVVEMEVAG